MKFNDIISLKEALSGSNRKNLSFRCNSWPAEK